MTPFAPRALDRGLTGVLASLLRLCGPAWNPNRGAGLVDPAAAQANRARDAIRARADDQVGHSAPTRSRERVNVLLDAWRAATPVGQRTLVYQRRGKSDTDVSLLQEPGIEGWSVWTVPTSMRNVEPRCRSRSGSRASPRRPTRGRHPSAPRPSAEPEVAA